MSHQRRDVFACDRCGDGENVPAGEQPPGWSRVMVSRPPLVSPLEADRPMDKMLCGTCSTEIDRWLRDTRWGIVHASTQQVSA